MILGNDDGSWMKVIMIHNLVCVWVGVCVCFFFTLILEWYRNASVHDIEEVWILQRCSNAFLISKLLIQFFS
eukprot:m.49482 g.49482  ORF g.49482 m.49482 type:complete len:72 (-) comp7454_c0_seq1:425-640(-)